MNYIFDAAVVVILILGIVLGAKKGAVKTLISFGVHIACVAVAFLFSWAMSESIYTDYVKEPVKTNITSTLNEFNVSEEIRSFYSDATAGMELSDSELESIISDPENMDRKLADSVKNSNSDYTVTEGEDALFSLLDEKLQGKLTKYMPPCGNVFFDEISGSKKEMYSLISRLDSDKEGAANYIEEHCIRKIMIRFIKIVSFVVFSLLFMAIAKIVMSVISKNDVVSAAGTADAVLGAVIGLLVAAVISAAVAMLCKMIILAGGSVSFFNEETISNSMVFRYLYNIDKLFIK